MSANIEQGLRWYHTSWAWTRKQVRIYTAPRAALMARIDMRWFASEYARLRGWKVELTPPQRRKVSP